MVLTPFSGVVLPEAMSALTSLNTRPVSGPSSWSIAMAILCDLSTSCATDFMSGFWIASAVPLTAGMNSPSAASLV